MVNLQRLTLFAFLQHPVRRVVPGVAGAGAGSLCEAAQVEVESKTSKQFISFQFQAIYSWRFQRGFDRVNLHRPTVGECGRLPMSRHGVAAHVEIETKS